MRKSVRLTLMGIAALSLCVLMAAVGYAIGPTLLEVRDNYFQTGQIHINLNDGQSVITPGEYLFEPGVTVYKDFFLENTAQSTDPVYYRFYMTEVKEEGKGDLKNYLEVTIQDGDTGTVLAQGSLADFESPRHMQAPEDPLGIGQRKTFRITFHMPKLEGNVAQNRQLSFQLSAVAVQSRNNPNKEFA